MPEEPDVCKQSEVTTPLLVPKIVLKSSVGDEEHHLLFALGYMAALEDPVFFEAASFPKKTAE